jgi:hypothetical protein
MPTFADLIKGPAAHKTILYPLPGTRADFDTGAWKGDTIPIAIRVLSISEEAEVVFSAREYSKGGADGDALFDLGVQVHTILRACLDAEHPERPFFDSFEQVAGEKTITRDHIAYLYEQQQLWQDECSPRPAKMTREQFMISVARTAGGDPSDFLGMSRALRWSFMRSMAAQLLALLAAKSTSGELWQAGNETAPS